MRRQPTLGEARLLCILSSAHKTSSEHSSKGQLYIVVQVRLVSNTDRSSDLMIMITCLID